MSCFKYCFSQEKKSQIELSKNAYNNSRENKKINLNQNNCIPKKNGFQSDTKYKSYQKRYKLKQNNDK